MAAPRPEAGYDPQAPGQSVALSLNSDLLRRIEPMTQDLTATVEVLLGRFLDAESRRPQDSDDQLRSVLHAVNALNQRDGFLSDEFSTL